MVLDWWPDEPPQGWLWKWLGGGVLPGLLLFFAISVAIHGEGTIPTKGRGVKVQGLDAYVYALGVAGLAIAFHAHFFWGNTKSMIDYMPLGKWIGTWMIVGAIAFILIRLLLRIAGH